MVKFERTYTISEIVDMKILGYKATTIRNILKKYPVITNGKKIAVTESVLQTIIHDLTKQPQQAMEARRKPKPKGKPIPGVTDDGLHLLPRHSGRRHTA